MKNEHKHIICLALSIMLLCTTSCNSNGDAFVSSVATSSVSPYVQESIISPATSEEHSVSCEPSEASFKPFTVAITGDICLADNWYMMETAKKRNMRPIDCFSTDLVSRMRSADFLLVNNEFCYSTNGSPLEGKSYTFRASPDNVNILNELGADLACVANNHVFDYGDQAFLDTLSTLMNAGIPYVGGGINEDEAYTPYYVKINGVTIAFCAASCAEKYYFTRVADGSSCGIAGTYNDKKRNLLHLERFLQEIREADENADYVIVYPHWGTEYSETPKEEHREMAKMFVEAGADAVVGAHAHILQGIEYYNGVPIVYNLGNFWFNKQTMDTVLLELRFSDQGIDVFLIPAIQDDCMVTGLTGTSQAQNVFKHVESISFGVVIDSDGRVAPSNE